MPSGRLSTCSSTAILKSSLDLSDKVQRKKNSVVLVCPRTFPRIFFICIKTYEYFLITECYLLSFFFSLPDCIVTGWSPWTSCSKKCNRGKKFRVRKIIKSEKKDGVSCPTKLKDRTRCRMQPCPTSWWVSFSLWNSEKSYFKYLCRSRHRARTSTLVGLSLVLLFIYYLRMSLIVYRPIKLHYLFSLSHTESPPFCIACASWKLYYTLQIAMKKFFLLHLWFYKSCNWSKFFFS